jgi:hypothetical protein
MVHVSTPPLELLLDVFRDGCIRADAVSLHLGQQVPLSQPGRRLRAALSEAHTQSHMLVPGRMGNPLSLPCLS